MGNGKKRLNCKALYDLLEQAAVIKADAIFIRKLIAKLEKSDSGDRRDSVYKSIFLLLNQDKVTRAKTNRRFLAKKVDLYTHNLQRFTKEELSILMRSCHLIQLTDGCTVACPWCYLNAQPYINYSVSFPSVKKFIHEYAPMLPSPFRFYWASDPLDWYDGEKSYVDIVKEYYKTLPTGSSHLVTTTSLPMGAEFTLLRLIQWFNDNLRFKDTRTFSGSDQHFIKDSALKKLFYKKQKDISVNSLFDYYLKQKFYYQKTRHILKISETDANTNRLKAVFDIISFMDISQSCQSWIEIETRDVIENEGIRKSGRAFSWDNRDMLLDSVSMACWDSVIVFPAKIAAMEMCGVTSKTQRGLEFWLLEPGKFTIPDPRAILLNSLYATNMNTATTLLPYAELTEYKSGKKTQKYTHFSLLRDIQTYGILLSKVIPSIEFIVSELKIEKKTFPSWVESSESYKKRRHHTEQLLKSQDDDEVSSILRFLMAQLDAKYMV